MQGSGLSPKLSPALSAGRRPPLARHGSAAQPVLCFGSCTLPPYLPPSATPHTSLSSLRVVGRCSPLITSPRAMPQSPWTYLRTPSNTNFGYHSRVNLRLRASFARPLGLPPVERHPEKRPHASTAHDLQENKSPTRARVRLHYLSK